MRQQEAHKCLDPEGIGSMLRTKINVNLGVSRDCKDYDLEMQKVMQRRRAWEQKPSWIFPATAIHSRSDRS